MTTNTNAALISHLQALGDRAYCDYIAKMKTNECLGWEEKVRTKKFGQAELTAHTKAGELLGRHKAFAEAATALTTAAAVPPEGFVMVPVELAERVQESLGEFLMDHGWSQRDMDTSDDFGAVLLAAAPKAEPVPAGEYPPLPWGPDFEAWLEARGESDLIDALRAYVDADRAMRAQAAPAAVAGPSEFPHEQMDAMALARYKVVPSTSSMFWSHAVVAGDGAQQLYVGREVECQNMVRKFAGAFLDGAFAFHSIAAAPTTQAAPAAVAGPGTYVQLVPDHCDRIVWRNHYHRLPLESAVPTTQAAPQPAVQQGWDIDAAVEKAWGRFQAAMDKDEPLPPPSIHATAHYGTWLGREAHWHDEPKAGAFRNAARMLAVLEAEIRRLHAELIAAQPAAPVAQGDAKDPLAGAAQWLLQAIDGCNISDLQSHLKIGFNRAERLMQDALAARSQAKEGANHD